MVTLHHSPRTQLASRHDRGSGMIQRAGNLRSRKGVRGARRSCVGMATKVFERPASNFFRSHHISEEAIGGEHNAEVLSAAREDSHFGHRRHHLLTRRSFLPAAPLRHLRKRNERVKNRRTVLAWDCVMRWPLRRLREASDALELRIFDG